jgi:2-amino-4-hydroxy-6-hydroxymethyldihydropteridine diphosphokinase
MSVNHQSQSQSATLAYVALGANIGEREQSLLRAIERLHGCEGIRVVACSPVYQTQPVGVLGQPLFLNMVIVAETTLDAQRFFDQMMLVEQSLGRTREVHWGPRIIDLDLLWFGEQTIDSDHLTVPHPYMFERAFVLAPLLDVVRQFSPDKQSHINDCLQRQPDKEDVQLWIHIDWQTASGRSAN